jgi:hypothetical protein
MKIFSLAAMAYALVGVHGEQEEKGVHVTRRIPNIQGLMNAKARHGVLRTNVSHFLA